MSYKTIQVKGYTHTVKDNDNRYDKYPDADYRGTGKALCGIVPKGETLEDWISKKNRRHL